MKVELRISKEAFEGLFADDRLTRAERELFLIIAFRDWGGEKGICKMTTTDVAERFKCSRTTAQRYLRHLADYGYIQHIYRIQMSDHRVIQTTNWDKAKRLNKEGNQILRAFYKVIKHGFDVRTKHKKHVSKT